MHILMLLIDQKKLLNLLKEMDYIIDADVASNKGAMDPVLSELIDYTAYHFYREENLMEAWSYPDLAQYRVDFTDLYSALFWHGQDNL